MGIPATVVKRANGTFVGLPVKLGRNGIEEIIQVKLTKKEKEELRICTKLTNMACRNT